MIRHRLCCLLLALPLAACSSLLNVQRTPFTIYAPQLAAPTTEPATGAVDWQLAVETPLASDALDTVRIVVMPSPGVIEVFPGARWRDAAPAMLRSLVVQGFQDSRRIVGVGSTVSGLHADYALGIDLRDFQLEMHDGAPRAVIRFQAKLLDYTTNRVLATQSFAEAVAAAGTDAASAFAAFEAALNRVIPTLVDWTLREGERAHGRDAGG